MTPLPEPTLIGMEEVNFNEFEPRYGYTADQMRAYGAAEYKRALSEANVSRYADWLDEAASDIADWGSYASAYHKEKYGYVENVEDFKDRAIAIRKLGATP